MIINSVIINFLKPNIRIESNRKQQILDQYPICFANEYQADQICQYLK